MVLGLGFRGLGVYVVGVSFLRNRLGFTMRLLARDLFGLFLFRLKGYRSIVKQSNRWVDMDILVCIYIYTYVCIYIYVYIHIYACICSCSFKGDVV